MRDKSVFSDWREVEEWLGPEVDAEALCKYAKSLGATAAVLDDIRVNEIYQLRLRRAGLRWLQFVGRAEQAIWADLLLRTSPSASPGHYTSVLRRSETRLLLGPEYALLRPQFSRVARIDPERPLKRVLLTFGGGDDRGAFAFVIGAIVVDARPEIEFVVVSGRDNPTNPLLISRCAELGLDRISLHIDPPNMAEIMSSCDLAVMAGGTTTYEAACLGLPMILLAIAENQVEQSEAWAEAGGARYVGRLPEVSTTHLRAALRSFLDDDRARVRAAAALRSRVDTAGAHRVAMELKRLLAPAGL